MKLAVILLAMAAPAAAQNLPEVIKQGEAVFTKSCASSYCHGPRGAGGGAPRISARGFTQNFINNIVIRGVPGTTMTEFATSLSRSELNAVVVYVATLNGIANPTLGNSAGAAPGRPTLSGGAERGRQLFSDAVRGFSRCSTCHQEGSVGIPVATPIARVPSSVEALRELSTPLVSTGIAAGESMPILMISNRTDAVMFYDLTTPPPVLRTMAPAGLQIVEGSAWRHSSVTGGYSTSELSTILEYLRTVARP
jgi:mono/diheme cytochrome c family protein